MPVPHSRDRLTPEELAQLLARQIASKRPPKPRYRLRDSVLVGRLIALAAFLLAGAAIVSLGVLGIDWWTERSTAAEVLTTRVVPAVESVSSAPIATGADPAGIHVVQPFVYDPGDVAITSAGFLPQLPSPRTAPHLPETSTSAGRPGPPPSSGSSVATVPSTTSPPPTTSPAPTVATVSTSTTLAPTTTTAAPTTTTLASTTTTCAGNSGTGNGNGNANCGP